MFADRVGTDGTLEAALWKSQSRAANPNTTTYGSASYRYVALDPSLITAENVPVTFGVSNASAATIPVAERTVEMYVHRRVVPQTGNEGAAKVGDFVGYVGWQSGGETFAVPVVAGGSALHASLHSLHVARAPMSRSALNASLAVGVPLDGNANPYCRVTSFVVDGDVLCGQVEVGKSDGDSATKGTIGSNVRIVLLGAESPVGPFVEVASVEADKNGRFTVVKPDRGTAVQL